MSPRGRLRENFEAWKSLTDSKMILNIISKGYKPPFLTVRELASFHNNQSALKHPDFVAEQTREQLQAQPRISLFPTAPGINAMPLVIFRKTYRLHAVSLPVSQIVQI